MSRLTVSYISSLGTNQCGIEFHIPITGIIAYRVYFVKRFSNPHPYFANDYAIAAQNYPKEKVLKIIHYIREADAQHKGIGNVSTDEGEILRLLVFKILH